MTGSPCSLGEREATDQEIVSLSSAFVIPSSSVTIFLPDGDVSESVECWKNCWQVRQDHIGLSGNVHVRLVWHSISISDCDINTPSYVYHSPFTAYSYNYENFHFFFGFPFVVVRLEGLM